MWIRSQDGLKLVNVEKIYISNFFNTLQGINCYKIYAGDNNVGLFFDKKQALNVLDDIQKIIITGDYVQIYTIPQEKIGVIKNDKIDKD